MDSKKQPTQLSELVDVIREIKDEGLPLGDRERNKRWSRYIGAGAIAAALVIPNAPNFVASQPYDVISKQSSMDDTCASAIELAAANDLSPESISSDCIIEGTGLDAGKYKMTIYQSMLDSLGGKAQVDVMPRASAKHSYPSLDD